MAHRKDNLIRLQELIAQTIQDIEIGEEMIEATESDRVKEALEAKNESRRQTLCSLREALLEDAQIRRDIF